MARTGAAVCLDAEQRTHALMTDQQTMQGKAAAVHLGQAVDACFNLAFDAS
jgi:hypothetical protein